MEFIQCVAVNTTLNDSRFTQPYSCNDRLIYITIDELMQAASDRIAVEAINCLSAFATAQTRAPFAGNAGGSRDAINGQTTGFIPSSDWDETLANPDWLAYCPFFNNYYWNSWQQVVSYNVSPTHTVAGGWGGAGTLSIPGKQGTYKVTLSININGVSRWYGIQ